jgi:hypothetical protein
MGKQGEPTREPVRRFITDEKQAHPEMTYAGIAARITDEFSVEIDRSTVGRS